MIVPVQALRFLMCVTIMLHHFLQRCDSMWQYYVDWPATFCTSLFFMLSGFVLALSSHRHQLEPPASFIARRYLRLMPLNLIGVLAAIIICPPLLSQVGHILADVFMLQSWIPDPEWYFSINAPLWFMSDMVFCCLAFPFIIRGGRAVWFALGAYAFALIVWGGWLCPPESENALYYIAPWCRVMDFALGVAAWYICEYVRPRLKSHGTTILQGTSILLAIAALAFVDYAPGSLAQVSWWWLPAIFIVISMAFPGGIFGRFLGHKVWISLGKMAFPLYVLHMPVISVVILIDAKFGLGLSIPSLFLIVLGITYVGALMADAIIEKPASKLIKRLFRSK